MIRRGAKPAPFGAKLRILLRVNTCRGIVDPYSDLLFSSCPPMFLPIVPLQTFEREPRTPTPDQYGNSSAQ